MTIYSEEIRRRIIAVKTADAISAMGGAPVSDYARELSRRWAMGEISGEQMTAALDAHHRKLAQQAAMPDTPRQ